MDAGRQLIRFSLPGGLFAIVATLDRLLFHLAWGERASDALQVLAKNALLTATGIVLLGFVIYQLYYWMYRPVLHLGIPPFRKTVYVHDRGGAILEGLRDIAGALDHVAKAHGITEPIGHLQPGRPNDDAYRLQWYRNAHVVRSLVNSIATTGDMEIKREYVILTDIYHALGACRIAVLLAVASTFAYVAATGIDRYEAHVPASVAATVGCLVVGMITAGVCRRNRHDTWHTLTGQLKSDLRLWFLRHPNALPLPPAAGPTP